MQKIHILILFIFLGVVDISAQNIEDILSNVDTLFMPGAAPGGLTTTNPDATPLVSSSPCNSILQHFSIATSYQNGRVITIGHESLLSNNAISSNDNLAFVINSMNWLSSGNRISIKQGWVNNANTSTLQNALIADNYTMNTINGAITSASLANTDILIFGNDWNNEQPYSSAELTALENFVANGGGIFIAGLGWSWPEVLSLYPMNAVANLFGIEFTTEVINDDNFNINGSPQLYNFYPDNTSTATPYCPSPFLGTNFTRGENLRVLRMAISTTGEFTEQNGGVEATKVLIEDWLEIINDTYGREYSVRFEIIPTNDQIIFPDPTSDPWETLPTNSGGCTNAGLILTDQAAVIDNIIGAANYDISHVIAGSPFGGGCAGGLKSGLSGELDIPVTRHEIGHQFSQSHTINFSDNTNYETENGAWTIQGGNAQSHAHGVSFHQLANFLANTVPTIGEKIPTGNTPPIVDAGLDYIIPISTPFTLTGSATSNAGDNLTYVWDNMSRGIPQSIPVSDDSQGALFMRLLPTANQSRTFPKISDVIANNNSNAQEQLPTQPRIMDIRLTVNDNNKIMYNGALVNASGSHSDDVQLTVADAGPFVVTSQNTNGITYLGLSQQEVAWNVSGTDAPPINTQNVRISLSENGGLTYPHLLVDSTPNTGSAIVTIPNITTTNARIKVEAVNNIYFDINTNDFQIDLISSTTDLNGFQVEIFPNPNKGFFNILLPDNLTYQAKLYDNKGVLLLDQKNQNYFDISSFPLGVYILEVTDLETDQQIRKKLVYMK